MPQEYEARIYLADKIQQIVAVCMGGEVKIIDLATPSHFAGADAKEKCFVWLRLFQSAARSFRISVADEKDRMFFLADHSSGQIMSGCLFRHHSRSDHEDFAASKLHFIELPLFQDDQV